MKTKLKKSEIILDGRLRLFYLLFCKVKIIETMKTITIQITPREFGKIAAAALIEGYDVTSYIIGIAAQPTAQPASTADSDAVTPGDTAEDVETVAPARGTSGLLALASDDVASFTPQH